MEQKLKKVLFITNIPAPYRIDFYNELGKHCELTVIFGAKRAPGITLTGKKILSVISKPFFKRRRNPRNKNRLEYI